MYRWDGADMIVRYDGTETRVYVHRAKERDGLTKDELRKLVETLTHALDCREAFDRSVLPSSNHEDSKR
jgi:hypothetical protein